MKVADLFAAIGFQVDKASVTRADKAIQGLQKKLDGAFQDKSGRWRAASGRFLSMAEKAQLGLGNAAKSLDANMRAAALAAAAAAAYGIGSLIKKGLEYNATLEETKNQIAGMLALSKKTHLSDEMGNADQLLANLQKRAASLPGTTEEYAQMLGALAQPITAAGLGLQDLEDITVSSVVAAKALGVEWQAAARDVDQALRGQFHSTDVFTGKLLGARGFAGEGGRAKFNAMSAKKRAAEIKGALNAPQISELAAAQGKTASGKWSTFVDALQQTLGKVTKPLFAKLVGYLEKVNEWLGKNSDKVTAFAATVGGVLVKALEVGIAVISGVIDLFKELAADEDIRAAFEAVAAAIGFIVSGFVDLMKNSKPFRYAVLAPFVTFAAILKAVGFVINNIGDALSWLGETAQAVGESIASPFVIAWDAVKSAFMAVYNFIADKVKWIEDKVDWVVSKATAAKEWLTGDSSKAGGVSWSSPLVNAAMQGGSMTMPAPSMAGGNTTTNNLNLTPTITVNGVSDPAKAAELVDARLQRVMADAYDTHKGGRR